MSSQRSWLARATLAGQPYTIQHVRPWRHNLVNLGALAGVLGVGVAVMAAAPTLPWWAYLPWATPVIGLVWFATFILVVHEASHGMFLLAEDRELQRGLNRIAGWTVCLPLTIHYDRHWIIGHKLHHQKPLEPDDPQAHNRRTGLDLLLTCLALCFLPGFAVIQRFVRRKVKGSSHTAPWLILLWPVLWTGIALLLSRGLGLGWTAAFAAFHGIQWLMALNEIKGALEHGGPVGEAEDRRLRSRSTLFPGRTVLMPWNISLHFEHHLAPLVPWYRLPTYHRALQEIVPTEHHASIFNQRVGAQLAGRLGAI